MTNGASINSVLNLPSVRRESLTSTLSLEYTGHSNAGAGNEINDNDAPVDFDGSANRHEDASDNDPPVQPENENELDRHEPNDTCLVSRPTHEYPQEGQDPLREYNKDEY